MVIQKAQEKKRETRRIVFEEDNHIKTSGKNVWMSLTQLTWEVFFNNRNFRTFASEMN